MHLNTLTEVISHVAVFYPDQGVTFIEGAQQEKKLSYHRLYQDSLKVLYYLQSLGLKPKDELVFQVEDNESLIVVFWACICGGIIAVPISIGVHEEHKIKLFNVWQTLNSPYLIGSKKQLEKLLSFDDERFIPVLNEMESRFINLSDINSVTGRGEVFVSTENDIAYVQFSSGSTGDPKGVILTHKNIISNVRSIAAAAGYITGDSMISWMPLTHDMGMIGFHINPLFCGLDQYLIPTSVFIRNPRLWLDKTTAHHISILCSPNFGYKYLLKNSQDITNSDWELSSVRLIYNGAEPISIQVINEFLDFLKEYGLKPESMYPVYGLAEATLAVSIPSPADKIKIYHLNRNKLTVKDKIEMVTEGDNFISFVNVGQPVNDCAIRICDNESNPVEEEIVGHIHIKGIAVTAGFYNNQKATQKVISSDGWLNTGDIGFMKDGTLCVIGRAKDVIFINGQNYFSHDLERALEEIEEIELNKVVVAGFTNHLIAAEEIVVFVIAKTTLEEFAQLSQKIQYLIQAKFGFEVTKIFPVKQIPKTTSGKLQRFRLLEHYQTGRFLAIEEQLKIIQSNSLKADVKLVKPVNGVEEKIIKIWEQLLNRKNITIEEDFFECGGNSLKAAAMTSALLQEFQVDLSMENLYDHSTIKALSKLIISADQKVEKFPVAMCLDIEIYPASSAQRRIYYTWLLNKETTAYNIPVALKINGNADIRLLENCIQQLIARYEPLRSYFLPQEQVSLKILKQVDFILTCSPCAENDILPRLKDSVQKFDLHTGPLFHIKLFNLNNATAVLFLDFHHAIADGLSVGHFITELNLLYNGLSLIPLNVTYKDFALAENQGLNAGSMEEQAKYWAEIFEGDLPKLTLPTDFQRPVFFDTSGDRIFRDLPEGQVKLLRDFAKINHCPLQIVFLSLYRIFLNKYSGAEEVIIGVPASGRKYAAFQNTFGMFVNTLPIRTKIAPDDSFLVILEKEKKSFYGALQHQDYPFEEIARQVNHSMDRSRNAVFDTMLMYNSITLPEAKQGDLIDSIVNFDPGFSKFDLSIEILDQGQQALTYCIEYASRLFLKDTIVAFADHFEQLIDLLLKEPGTSLAEMTVLSEEECNDLIYTENKQPTDYSKTENIYQLFAQVARQDPGSVAVQDGLDTFTYQQLNHRISNFSNWIENTLAVTADDIIAVFLPRSEKLITSLFSVLKAGATILPVDTGLPLNRIEYLLYNSKCKAVITDAAGSNYLKTVSVNRLILIDELDFDVQVTTAQLQQITTGSRAYVIYTSGTTGEPKGVEIDHRSLINYVEWAIREYVPEGKKYAFPFFTSISFDLTLTSIFVPLLSGNKIVVYPDQLGAAVLTEIFKGNSVDVIKLTPSHLRLVLDNNLIVSNGFSAGVTLIVGGEVLDFDLAKEIQVQFDQPVQIFNEYGPTEATIGCMIYKFDPNGNTRTVPIGKPAQNTQLYILDQFLHPVPNRVTGELYIAGDGLSTGYLFNPGLTNQKFIENPFIPGKKMYKSGDLVKRLANGEIEFIGRNDSQVKINGYRIELAEVEFQLKTHPHINEVVVLDRWNDHGKRVLYAYFTKNEVAVNEALLKNYITEKLPYYMIPERMIAVEEFTLNLNGKIDLSALPLAPRPAERAIVPINELQILLLSVWKEVLNTDQISIHDNFYELGGDSIKAIQISARALAKGADVQVKDILTYHTVEEVSVHVKQVTDYTIGAQELVSGDKELLAIEHWFINQGLANPNFYHQSVLLKFNSEINKTWINEFFDWAIYHHDGLRLNYDPLNARLFYNNNHLNKGSNIPEVILDINNLSDLLPQKSDPSFDITNSLLIQITKLNDKKQGNYLYINAHHLIVDGLSWRILLEDLYVFYKAKENDQPANFSPKTASLKDWMNELTLYSAQLNIETETAFWKSNLPSADQLLPLDFYTLDWRMIHARKISDSLNIEDTTFLLKNANVNYRTDAYILLLTALSMTIKNWTGMDSFSLELEGHGRNLPGINVSRTTGWFTNIFPVKLQIDQQDIGDQIISVKEQIRNVPNHGLGYGILKYYKGLLNEEVSHPADIRFNYLGQFSAEFNNDVFSYDFGLSGFETAPENNLSAKIDCNAVIVNGQLQLEIIYNEKAHTALTIMQFRNDFFKSLDAIFEHLKGTDKTQFTPSDFMSSMINQEDIDVLFD